MRHLFVLQLPIMSIYYYLNDNCDATFSFYLKFWEKVFFIFYRISDKSTFQCNIVLSKLEELLLFIEENVSIFTSPLIVIILDVVIQVYYSNYKRNNYLIIYFF